MMLIEFEGKRPKLADDVFVAPTAVLIGDVEVGAGSTIWFGAVLRADYGPIRIGRNCSIQDNVVLHADVNWPTLIGDGVTIGHSVAAEGCTVGDNALIGTGSVVLPNSTIGAGALVAANSTVLEHSEIPAGMLAAGSPAQVKRALSGRAREWTQFSAAKYIELGRRYRRAGIDKLVNESAISPRDT